MGLLARAIDSFARQVTSYLTGSEKGRQVLERWIDIAQGSLGIGVGSDVDSSGESVIFEQLQARGAASARPLCVFGVGANQGQFLSLLTKKLGALPLHVHCFEPSPTTYQLLIASQAGRANVSFNLCGLGSARGEFDLYSDEVGSGLASLSKRRLDHVGIKFERSERVQIRTLDDYCAEQQIEHIDLLKIDVEGHELDVLKGARRMFAEQRIEMITFEFGGGHIDSRTFLQDFFYFFQANGMAGIYRIMPAGTLARIDGYQESLEQFRTTNFLVLRQ